MVLAVDNSPAARHWLGAMADLVRHRVLLAVELALADLALAVLLVPAVVRSELPCLAVERCPLLVAHRQLALA